MIRTRLMSVAFLLNGDRILFMRRSLNAELLPGMWASIGGHLEVEEINDPRAACLREIKEETGLTENDVVDLLLKYVVLRRKGNEIRIQYIYFGSTHTEDVGTTEEGELHWIQIDKAFELDMSATSRFILEHYTRLGSKTDCVYVGTIDVEHDKPVVRWAALRDWE
ncbi:MAG: NUDIX domain-containing protein [Chloroflexota bacterium]